MTALPAIPYEPEKFTEEEVRSVFGPGSNSAAAHDLQRKDPGRYQQLKQIGCYKLGIIPESSLPRESRLTKSQLEESYNRQHADDVVALTISQCSELGLPVGSKLKQSVLRRLQGKA